MSGRSRRAAAALSLAILVLTSLSPVLIDGLSETTPSKDASSRSTACSAVCINEMMPNADGLDQGVFPNGEWVELYNSGSVDVSLENCTDRGRRYGDLQGNRDGRASHRVGPC